MSQLEIISLALQTVNRNIIDQEQKICGMWDDVNEYESDPEYAEYVARLYDTHIPNTVKAKNLNIQRAEYLTTLAHSIENPIP
jgi:hypothetical protein